jgi:hypothetical protein
MPECTEIFCDRPQDGGTGKVADAPQAQEDFQRKPIPIKKIVRGKAVFGAPLTAEDGNGSIPKTFYTGG